MPIIVDTHVPSPAPPAGPPLAAVPGGSPPGAVGGAGSWGGCGGGCGGCCCCEEVQGPGAERADDSEAGGLIRAPASLCGEIKSVNTRAGENV